METLMAARQIGVTPGTLRLWERRGLIGPIRKDARGWRIWTEKELVECRKLLTKLHGTNAKGREGQ